MTYAHRLKLRCFLEGIEVPIIACNVAVQPNSPAQFQVQIPATDRSFEFFPRTLVHVFISDLWDGPSALVSDRNFDEQVEERSEALEAEEEEERARQQYYTDRTLMETTGASEIDQRVFALTGPNGGATGTEEGSDTILPEEGAQTSAAAIRTPSMVDQERLDARVASLTGGSATETAGMRDNPFTDDDENWKFFIGGEVIGFEFQKSDASRFVTLHCMDWSLNWDTCYQYKVNVANLTGDGMAAFVGAGTTFFDTFFSSTTSAIVNAVNQQSVTQPYLTGLLSGVVRLLESVGGVYTGNESSSINGANPQNVRGRFRGCNDFFSIAELRLKLVYMITAAESDDSSRRYLAARAFAWWGRRYASQLGQIASFREILNVMMQYIFHSAYAIPAPRMFPPQERLRTRTVTSATNFASSPQGRRMLNDLARAREQVSALRDSLQSGEARSVSVNDTLRSVASSTNSLASQATAIGDSAPASRLTEANTSANATARRFQGRNAGDAAAIYSGNRADIDSELSRTQDNITAAESYLNTATLTHSREVTRTVNTARRLNMQVIRPDIFMVAPPRCNVIFPEHVSQISFSRMYLREVTRMRLTVSDEIFGPNALLDSMYFAPDVELMGAFSARRTRGGDSRAETGRTLQQAPYAKRLMEHELFTGVVPIFERMNEVNIYAMHTEDVNYRGARIPYVVRAVNHQFFKSRWAPRTMEVAGKFNPYIVPGFPALVMDRYMTREQVAAAELRGSDYLERTGRLPEETVTEGEGARPGTEESAQETSDRQYDAWRVLKDNVPTQFVGLIEGLNHSVTQNNAGTSISLTHARTHRENEELLGANRRTLTSRSLIRQPRGRTRPTRGAPGGRRQQPTGQPDGRAIRTTTVAAIEAPEVGMVGPYFGEVTAVAESQQTGDLPLFGTFSGDTIRRSWRTFPVEVEMRARDLGDEVVTQIGDPDARVTLHAYDVTEAIDRWRGQEVDVPLEDFVRPPWMSDVWKNDRIGATYQQFFGTGALTDASTIEAGSSSASDAQGSPVEELLSDMAAEERDRNMQDPIRASGESTQGPGLDINIERAIDLLVRTYSAIKHNGLDVHEFIRAYTWRPPATLRDMFGSADLEIDQDGNVTSGTEGFHSRAFGHGELGRNLRNLVNDDVRTILGFNEEEDRGNVLERMDKRSEKAGRVLAYVEELWRSRGLLG